MKFDYPDIVTQFMVREKPHYVEIGNEREIFHGAFHQKLSLLLKGPTGCGKTRFVESVAHELQLPLITISCHIHLDHFIEYMIQGDHRQEGDMRFY